MLIVWKVVFHVSFRKFFFFPLFVIFIPEIDVIEFFM